MASSLFAGNPETGFNPKRPDSFCGLMVIVKFREFFTCLRRPKVDIAFADYVECIPGKTGQELVIAGFSPTTVSCVRGNVKEDVATLTLEDTQGAARLSVWSVAGDNIVNDFESVNFIQSEKLRCMNNASESLDGEESTA